MIKFGTAGLSQSFFDEGLSKTLQMPEWLARKGLEVFEYSFGRGVNGHTDSQLALGEMAAKHGIEMTVHAPYYINFASNEPEKAEKSIEYVMQSVRAVRNFGGNRCVFHVGSQGKQPREQAFETVRTMFDKLLQKKHDEGYDDIIICPETMGNYPLIGSDAEEIITLCKTDDSVYPCYDFGHINCIVQGALKQKDDYKRYIDRLFEQLGDKKASNMHVHFSKIMFSERGERKHLTFADNAYGPEFEPLAEVFFEYGMTPVVISESDGTQAEDAAEMKRIFYSLSAK